MKKILGSILIIIFAAILVLSAAKNTIARVTVEKAVEVVTGLQLKIKDLNIGILKTNIDIDGLKLYNPPGYKDNVMLNMPDIYIDYNLPAILKGEVHLNSVRIDMKEFVVVKNRNGELNLDALKTVQSQEAEAKPADKPDEKGKASEIQIDSLELKIGKVIYKDYSKGTKPSVHEFDINLDEKYSDINDPNKLVSLIVVKALMNTSIAKLTDFDLKGLQGGLGSILGTAQKVLGATADQAAEAVTGTTEALKEGVDELKGVFKLPFGGKKE